MTETHAEYEDAPSRKDDAVVEPPRERQDGAVETRTLRLVDPASCRMWARHNRAYDLLTEDECRALIDGLKAQGKQEFPAIVRETGEPDTPYEVVCGARRHFAVAWLRAHAAPQFRFLVEVRDLTDEQAFRLADIENRDRADISDYERAADYLDALDRYYGGKQRAMAARLEVSEPWLNRHLQLARLPQEIVAAFPSIRDLREVHARALRPHLGRPNAREALLAEARAIREAGSVLDPEAVMTRLRAVVAAPKAPKPKGTVFRRNLHESGITMQKKGRTIVLRFADTLSRAAVESAFEKFLKHRFET